MSELYDGGMLPLWVTLQGEGLGEMRGNIGAFALTHKHMKLSEIYVTIVLWRWRQRRGMRVLE